MATTLSQSIRPKLRTIDGLSIRYAERTPHPDHALLWRWAGGYATAGSSLRTDVSTSGRVP
jgi:hypothetical protein